MLINLSALNHCIRSEMPFKYFLLSHFLSDQTIKQLFETLPFDALSLTTRVTGSDKTYQLYNYELIDHLSNTVFSHLQSNKTWLAVMENFLTEAYKSSVGQLVGKELKHCSIQAMLKVYKEDSYISMHTDDPAVALTHLLFLNPYYDFKHNGNLNFHDTDGKKIVSIPPLSSLSVIFERSDISFHSVDKCTSSHSPKVTLQVVFWKDKIKRNINGRHYYDNKNAIV